MVGGSPNGEGDDDGDDKDGSSCKRKLDKSHKAPSNQKEKTSKDPKESKKWNYQ